MKPFVFLICATFFLLFTNQLHAQSRYTGFVFGIPTLSNFYGEVEDNSWGVNFLTIGLYHDRQVNRRLWIQPELRAMRMGSKFPSDDSDFRNRQNILYLHMPVLCNIYFSYNGYLQIGPYLNILRHASMRDKLYQEIGTILTLGLLPVGYDNTDDFNTWDAGIVMGVGLGTGDGSVLIRYHLGLIDINAVDSQQILHNQAIEFVITFSFRSLFTDSKTILFPPDNF